MKRYFLITVLMTMLVSTAAFSQRAGEFRGRPQEDREQQMRLRNMERELRQREEELEEVEAQLQRREAEPDKHKMGLDHHRRMQGLELEQRSIALEHRREAQEHPACCPHHRKGAMLPFLIVCFVVHILVAVWVYKDIRRRNFGSGIWIVIALLTGLLGVLVYAIVRLGDIQQGKSSK